MQKLEVFFVLTILLLPFSSYGAPSQASSESNLEKAKHLFKQATKKYQSRDYVEALEYFTEARKLTNLPTILLNIAQCHRMIGNAEKAIHFYELYKTKWDELNPHKPLPYSEEVDKHIAKLKAQFVLGNKSVEVDGKVKPDQIGQVDNVVLGTNEETHAEKDGEGSHPFYKTWWFWTIVGVAVAGTVAAVTIVTLQPEPSGVDGSIPPSNVYLLHFQ